MVRGKWEYILLCDWILLMGGWGVVRGIFGWIGSSGHILSVSEGRWSYILSGR